MERERRGSGRSSELEQSGERAKSAAQNPLHHKTTKSKTFKIYFKSYHETVNINSLGLLLCCVENKSDYLLKEHHFNYAALWSGHVKYRKYRVAQKSKPLPNYEKIVLNRIKACE